MRRSYNVLLGLYWNYAMWTILLLLFVLGILALVFFPDDPPDDLDDFDLISMHYLEDQDETDT